MASAFLLRLGVFLLAWGLPRLLPPGRGLLLLLLLFTRTALTLTRLLFLLRHDVPLNVNDKPDGLPFATVRFIQYPQCVNKLRPFMISGIDALPAFLRIGHGDLEFKP